MWPPIRSFSGHTPLHSTTTTSIPEVVNAIQSGSTKIVNLVSETLQKIEKEDKKVGAFLAVNGDKALALAQELDKKIASGDKTTLKLPLLGLPVAVKDNICTTGKEGYMRTAPFLSALYMRVSAYDSKRESFTYILMYPWPPFPSLPTGIPTTASSKVLDGYVPSYDATSVAKLVAAGAIVVGKTNMDEFGMGSTTETSGYHITRNPRDLSRSPGNAI